MQAARDNHWWMTNEGRLLIGVPTAPEESMASGSVCPEKASGIIRMYRGKPARLTNLPRGLLDELAAHFPGVRWWVQDVPERMPARAGV
jgi:hypothetical protein